MGLRVKDREPTWWDYAKLYPLFVVIGVVAHLGIGMSLFGDDLDRELVGESLGWAIPFGVVIVLVNRHHVRSGDGADDPPAGQPGLG